MCIRKFTVFAFYTVCLLFAPRMVDAEEMTTGGGYTFEISTYGDPHHGWGANGQCYLQGGSGLLGYWDYFQYLSVDEESYHLGRSSAEVTGRWIDFEAMTTRLGVTVSRRAHVPESGGDFVMYVDSFENTGGSELTTEVMYYGWPFFKEIPIEVFATHSGDLDVDETDYWWIFHVPDPGPEAPVSAAIAFFGFGATNTPTDQTLTCWAHEGHYCEYNVTFSLTIGAGERMSLVSFIWQGDDTSTLQTDVETLVADISTATTDMSFEELDDIVNWTSDADGDGFTYSEGDCDDSNELVYPEAPEICDGLDNDCDEDIDEGFDRSPFYPDIDGDSHGDEHVDAVLACVAPPLHVVSNDDCNDLCAICYPGATEFCDDLDNDCDDLTDEDLLFRILYRDSDRDGYGVTGTERETCREMTGWVTTPGDCNDSREDCHPGAKEVCDRRDNNCDGETDEGLLHTVWADADGDTYGNPASIQRLCTIPNGYVQNSDDCNDMIDTAYPGATEVCDEIDNNCDGEIDEGLLTTFYADTDQDGYGNPDSPTDACTLPEYYSENSDDCDDTNENTYLGADEIADGEDNDCDGETDEGIAGDGDGDIDGDADVDGDGDVDGDSDSDADGDPDGGTPDEGDEGCSCNASSPGNAPSAFLRVVLSLF